MVAVGAYDSTSVRLAHLVTIQGTQPSGWTLYLCSSGAVMTHSSGVQRYQPRIVEMGEVPTDSGGFGRFNFSLQAIGPYVATQGSFDVRYTSLLEMLRQLEFVGATVTISLRAANTVDDEEEEILRAEVSEVADVTATNVTIECEIREALANVDVPAEKITLTYWANDAEKDQTPRESLGRPIPYAIGSPEIYIPPALTTLTGVSSMTRDKIRSLREVGLTPRGFECLPVQRGNTWQGYAWSEKKGLSAPDWLTGPKRDVYVYESSTESYARIFDSPYGVLVAHDSVPAWSAFQNFALYGLTWGVLPILPKRVSETDSVGLTDGKRALNTKLEEWATLAPGGRAVFELPVLSPLGRIALNWRDGGGGAEDHEFTTAPAGVGIFAVCSAGSTVNNLPDMGKLFICWPSSTSALFGIKESLPLRSSMIADPLLPEVGRYDPELWRHTKLYNWDFSAETDDTGSSLYHASNGTNAGQFRIIIDRAGLDFPSDAQLYIHWLGLRIGYEAARPEVRTTERRNPLYYAGPGGRRRRGQAKNVVVHEIESVAPPTSGLIIDTPGLADEPAGTYTGTGDRVLESPLHAIHHWLAEYGEQSVVTSGSAHGSFPQARTRLDQWASWGAGGASIRLRSSLQLTDQSPLSEGLFTEAMSGLPQTVIRRNGSLWSAYVWMPFGSTYYATASRYRSLEPIDVLREFVFGDTGIDLGISRGWSEVWNHVDVEYDIDPSSDRKRIASVKATASDDGYGAEWPVVPFGGATAIQLSAYSTARYGKRVHDPIRLLGVFDPRSALACGLHLLWRYYRPPVYLSFAGTTALRDLKYGQIFTLGDELETALGLMPFFVQAGTSWSDLVWRCLGNQGQGGAGGVYTCQIRAELIPLAVGDEIVGGGVPGSPSPSGIFGGKQEHLNDEGWLP